MAPKKATSGATKKPANDKVENLRKENDSLKLENAILRRDFDPNKKGTQVSEETIMSIFEDTIKRLELELKKAKENPPSSTEKNDETLKELQGKISEQSKEIEKLKKVKTELDNTNTKLQKQIKEVEAISSKNSADKQLSTGGNVSADLKRAEKENREMRDNISTIKAERDDYKERLKKSETMCKEKENKISELQKQLQTSPAVDDSKDTKQEKKNDAENTSLKKQISGLEGEIKSLNEKLTTESNKNVAMEKQISDIEENNKSLNQKLTEEREEIESLKRGKELMEKKNDELRSELKEEKDAKASMQKDLSKAKDNLKNANTQIQNTSASSSKEEVKELKKENEDNKKKVAELQSTCHDAFEKLENCGKEISKMKKDHAAILERKEATIADLKKKNNTVESRGPSSSAEVSKLRKEIIGLKDENDHLKTRLSELVGAKLTENNPDIADLSDMNRPQKLGEMYSELYDNEWTDAFEEIETSGKSESVAIKHLHTILWEASAFCEDLSFQYTKKLDSVLFRIPDGKENNVETSEMPVTIRKQIKDLRKGISPYLKADVSEKYVLTSKEKKIGVNLKQFMKRCAELCWLMRMQDPPVVLTKKNNAGPFNGELYRTYTKSGKTVDFVVWPPLLLHDNGPTLAKGVAQGK